MTDELLLVEVLTLLTTPDDSIQVTPANFIPRVEPQPHRQIEGSLVTTTQPPSGMGSSYSVEY